jgi:hypothetical protein
MTDSFHEEIMDGVEATQDARIYELERQLAEARKDTVSKADVAKAVFTKQYGLVKIHPRVATRLHKLGIVP